MLLVRPLNNNRIYSLGGLQFFSSLRCQTWRKLSSNCSQQDFAVSKLPLLQKLIDVNSTNDAVGKDSNCNVPPHIAKRIGTNLHLKENHPLNTIKKKIEAYWQGLGDECNQFKIYDDFHPIVSTYDNFDSLLIPKDHVSRSKSDTYYLDAGTVLRTHTSAHQLALLNKNVEMTKTDNTSFLVSGDVYRRDEIDSSHYPIFHQMEGVRMFDKNTRISDIEHDLKHGLEGMATMLFGEREMRWVDAYFPFTNPSFELEVYFEGEWLEVLGCGVIEKDIIKASGRGDQPGWAFGLGLERLAMVLFDIPDIRLFWTDDSRFHEQFETGKIIKFRPYSKYPPCLKDISFWTPTDGKFHDNDINEVLRGVAGDLVENVELIDEFTHPKTKRLSKCFRIRYRSMDRSLTNAEIDSLQEKVRSQATKQLGVELR